MRKMILLFCVTLLYGCKGDETSIYVNPEGSIPFANVTHFEYENHQYIKFRADGATISTGGVVHNPDCKYCNIKGYDK